MLCVGKLKFILDESIDYYKQNQSNTNERSSERTDRLQEMELRRRIAVEKELERTNEIRGWKAIFDNTDTLLIYSCILGIKVVHVGSGVCVRVFGKDEGTRFIEISLYQGEFQLSMVEIKHFGLGIRLKMSIVQ